MLKRMMTSFLSSMRLFIHLGELDPKDPLAVIHDGGLDNVIRSSNCITRSYSLIIFCHHTFYLICYRYNYQILNHEKTIESGG